MYKQQNLIGVILHVPLALIVNIHRNTTATTTTVQLQIEIRARVRTWICRIGPTTRLCCGAAIERASGRILLNCKYFPIRMHQQREMQTILPVATVAKKM